MKTKIENSAAATGSPKPPVIKIFGVGGAGVGLLNALMGGALSGAEFLAIDTEAPALAASSAPVKIHLETKLLRGLGTGCDPERGRALAEEQFATLQAACEGTDLVFLIAGLGGGAGSGITPVLARAAAETGALVLAFVTLPFWCEGNRRQSQAQQALDQLKAAADGVICLPNQKAFRLIDETTGVLDTFALTGGFLAEVVRGVWRLLARPGLIQIHFDDLRTLLGGRHSESAFACVEAAGPARSREAVEQLLKHPLLDEGRALAECDALLVSLTGGRDLTMAEVHRVMEQINRRCDRAQVMMGATIDAELDHRLSVTLIAASNPPLKAETSIAPDARKNPECAGAATPPKPRHFVPGAGGRTIEQRGQLISRHTRPRRGKPGIVQPQLPLAIVSKGRFDKSEPTIHKGEDLDIPTYIRRGVPLN